MDYSQGTEPDRSDLFPEFNTNPQFRGLGGPLLMDPKT